MDKLIDDLARLAMQGHVGLARALADEKRAADPFTAYLAQAMIAAAVNDKQALSAYAQTAEAAAPDHPLVPQMLAMMHLVDGALGDAEREARRAVMIEGSARSMVGLARVLAGAGRLSEAELTLRELLARSDDSEARLELGKLRDRQGDPMGALEQYARAFQLEPNDPRAMRAAMEMYHQAAWSIGVALLTRVTRGNAHSPEVYFALDMLALGALRQIDETPLKELVDVEAAAAKGALEEAPNVSIGAQLRLARELVDGDPDKVQQVADLLARLALVPLTSKEAGELAFCEGLLAQRRSQSDPALAAYERAVMADPEHSEAACNAVNLLLGRADRAALERIGVLLGRVPLLARRLQPALTYNEALYYEALGRRDEASALVAFLSEARLGELAAPVRSLKARLAGFRA